MYGCVCNKCANHSFYLARIIYLDDAIGFVDLNLTSPVPLGDPSSPRGPLAAVHGPTLETGTPIYFPFPGISLMFLISLSSSSFFPDPDLDRR